MSISVPKSLLNNTSDTIDIIPNSHYRVDYILYFFQKELVDLLKTNSNISKDPKFIEVIEKYDKLVENIVTAREKLHGDNDYAPITHNNIITNGSFGTTSYYTALSNPNVKTFMEQNNNYHLQKFQELSPLATILLEYSARPIGPDGVDYTQDSDGSAVKFDGKNWAWSGEYGFRNAGEENKIPLNFYFHHWDASVGGKLRSDINYIYNLIKESKTLVQTIPSSTSLDENISALLKIRDTDTQNILTQIRTEIEFGEYNVMMDGVQILLRDLILPEINKVTDLLSTEGEIIKSIPSPSDYYENIFDIAQLEPAIVKPNREKETVPRSKVYEELEKALKHDNENGYDSNLLLNILGKNSQSKQNKILQNLQDFNKKLNEKMGISDNSVLKKIMYSLIFTENDEPIAKYLDEAERKTRDNIQKQKEMTYINTLFLKDTSKVSAIDSDNANGWKQQNSARGVGPYVITIDGDNITSDYTLASIYDGNQINTQLGGLSNNLRDVQTDVNRIIENNRQINDTNKKINDGFFVDINNGYFYVLEQRNQFLIEMMNVLMVSNRLISGDSNTYEIFNSTFGNYIRNFKTELKTAWSILNNQINITGDVMNDMVVRGTVLTSQIKSFLDSNGFVQPKQYDNNPIINRLSLINTVRTLSADINLPYSEIVNIIANIYSNSMDISNIGNGSVRNIYKNMKKYYSDLKDFQLKMDQIRNEIISENINVNNIIDGIGKIISQNISTVDIYTKNITLLLGNLDIEINNSDKIREIHNDIKIKRDKLHSHLTNIKTNLLEFSSSIDNETAMLSTDITGHIVNILKNSENIDQYSIIFNNLNTLDESNKMIIDAYSECEFIRRLIPKREINQNNPLLDIYDDLKDIDKNRLWENLKNLYVTSYMNDFMRNYLKINPGKIEKNIKSFVNNYIQSANITIDEFYIAIINDYKKFKNSVVVLLYNMLRKLIILLENINSDNNNLNKQISDMEFDIDVVRSSLYREKLSSPSEFIKFVEKFKTSTDINQVIVDGLSANTIYINDLIMNTQSLKTKISVKEFVAEVNLKIVMQFTRKEYDYLDDSHETPITNSKYKNTIEKKIVEFESINKKIITSDNINNLDIILRTFKFIIENYHYLLKINIYADSSRNDTAQYSEHQELYKMFREFLIKIKSNHNIPHIHRRILIINDIDSIYDIMTNVPDNRVDYIYAVGNFKVLIKKYIDQIKILFDDVLENIIMIDFIKIPQLFGETEVNTDSIIQKYDNIFDEIKITYNTYENTYINRKNKLSNASLLYKPIDSNFISIEQNGLKFTITSKGGYSEYELESESSGVSFVDLYENKSIGNKMVELNAYDAIYLKLINERSLSYESIDKNIIDITEKIQYYNKLYDAVSKVMFDKMFYTRPFVNKNDLFKKYTSLYDSYKSLSTMFGGKVINLIKKYNKMKLLKGQINAFNAFTMALDRKVGNEKLFDERNVYLKMSFGLINFYRQTINTILEYLDNQDHSEMCQVHKYLFETHYISLKRISKLFEWIYQYQLSVLATESNSIQNSDRILLKRIELLKTQGNINKIFAEFNNIRYMLDDYRSTLMNKVTMHLRINDFKFEDNSESNPISIPDPKTSQYNARELPFSIDNNTNKLIINNNKIPISPEKLVKLQDSTPELQNIINQNGGIKFDNAYDVKNFPNADIISNYMSLATNIKNGKGVAIMTYGYSGVGKTATIFGKNDPDPNKRIIGLLQSTLEEFNSKIKLRIYEMYGLGTQYNFYWNPSDTQFPDIYQVLIHHRLNTSNSAKVSTDKYYAITNRSDIFSYISELQGPGERDFYPTINRSLSDRNANAPSGKLTESTYVNITRDQYINFGDLINNIDNNRKNNGIKVDIFFNGNTGNKQIKSTVNNPESSRSIVIYEFQIESESEPGKYTPLIIYDLPGKEDLYKTYILPTRTSETPNAIPDIQSDVAISHNGRELSVKEKKSTYILNPLLIAGFDNNYESCIKNIESLDPREITNPDKSKRIVQQIRDTTRLNIIRDLMETEIQFDRLDIGAEVNLVSNSTRKIRDFYNVADINKFADLFILKNITDIIKENGTVTLGKLTNEFGLLAASGADNLRNADGSHIKPVYIFYVSVIMALIKVFLKYKLFDIVAGMISSVTNWSFDQIYMFFEAYYINENVLGLLDYLVKKVVKVNQSFPQQTNDKYQETLSKNLSKLNNYLYANSFKNNNQLITLNYNFYKIDNKFLASNDDSTKELINYAKEEYQLTDSDGIYGKSNRAKTQNKLFNPTRIDLLLHNKSSYDSNKLFRSSTIPYNTEYINPDTMKLEPMTNAPFIYDILMPYKSKLEYYYLFYVMSNVNAKLKAEEQIKLLDNSTPFIKALYDSRSNDGEKKTCV